MSELLTNDPNLALRQEIELAINRHSAENGSNTPDFILACFLTDCLKAFDAAVTTREYWYGRIPGSAPAPEAVTALREVGP